MRGEVDGWVAIVEESWDGMAVLQLVRRGQGSAQQIVGFDENGTPVIFQLQEGTAGTFPGFRIPHDAIHAVAEALKPGPSQGEVKRLEESLGVERARVDQVLAERLRP